MTHRILWVVLALGTNIGLAQEEIRITVPNDFENFEGDIAGDPNFMGTPFRFQDLYPASEFASLPETHRNIVGLFLRPDASVTESRTATYADVQLRMSTTQRSELDTVFDNNLSNDATVVYEGPLTVSTQATGPLEGPREFEYRYDFEAPFFYDPAAGNLVFDVITSSGYTPSQREDQHSGAVSMFGGPGDTEGGPLALSLVVQFSFVPAQVIPGDFNEDSVLDVADYGILVSNFNRTFDIAESFSRGDINLDRRVNLLDFLNFRQLFNAQGVAAVPEPSSVVLCFMGLGAMVVRAKKHGQGLNRSSHHQW